MPRALRSPREWPHTRHWGRIETTYREIAGSRWRTVAAIELGVVRSNLRTAFDRKLPPAAVQRLGRFLSDRLGRHVITLDEQIEHAVNVRREVERGDYDAGGGKIAARDGRRRPARSGHGDGPSGSFIMPTAASSALKASADRIVCARRHSSRATACSRLAGFGSG
jgi:hypothetical protein